MTIHPFDDGNGRIARAIGDMMLAREENSGSRFYNLSKQINLEKKSYYIALESQQKKKNLDITEWLHWFLNCLEKALIKSRETIQQVIYSEEIWRRANKEGVNERQRKVIHRMLNNFQGYINSSKYSRMTKCSVNKALEEIVHLESLGVLIKSSKNRKNKDYRLVTLEEIQSRE